MTDDADLVAFERDHQRRQKIVSALGAIAVGALLVWKISAFFDGRGEHEKTPPGAHLYVDAKGGVSMKDCAGGIAVCIDAAHAREYDRAGGGRYTGVIHVSPGAPRDAVISARRALLTGGFTPEETND